MSKEGEEGERRKREERTEPAKAHTKVDRVNKTNERIGYSHSYFIFYDSVLLWHAWEQAPAQGRFHTGIFRGHIGFTGFLGICQGIRENADV